MSDRKPRLSIPFKPVVPVLLLLAHGELCRRILAECGAFGSSHFVVAARFASLLHLVKLGVARRSLRPHMRRGIRPKLESVNGLLILASHVAGIEQGLETGYG